MNNDASADGPPPQAPADKLEYDWPAYVALIESLAAKVKAAYRPDQVVGIASGGLIPAMILAKCLDVPLGVMAAASYETGESNVKNVRGPVRLGSSMASIMPKPGRRVLLVDDLTDSGGTMTACAAWLREFHGDVVREIRTAAIWHKTRSTFRPDFLAAEVQPNPDGRYPWIVQPFEKYEREAG